MNDSAAASRPGQRWPIAEAATTARRYRSAGTAVPRLEGIVVSSVTSAGPARATAIPTADRARVGGASRRSSASGADPDRAAGLDDILTPRPPFLMASLRKRADAPHDGSYAA